MSNQYDPVRLAQDATKFARTRFGKHYVKRLEDLRESHIQKASDLRLTNEVRANHGVQAATLADEIGYFTTAQTIVRDPNLLERLRVGFKKRKEAEDKDV